MKQNTPSKQINGKLASILLILALMCGLAPGRIYADGNDNGGADGIGKRVSSVAVTPVITSLNLVNGQLLASGIASAVVNGKTYFAPFSAVPVTLTTQDPPTSCPVLNLQLAPINLDLLGLVVNTSQICLNITAVQGGGLLGDLLCGVANLLNSGTPLGQALATLTGSDLNNLLLGVTAILNGALANLNQAILTSITPATGPAQCSILNLTLGPLNLNLLGLQVGLLDCANGPVTVTITGQRGELLGNLLCGLLGGGGLNLGSTLSSILGSL